MASGAVHGLAHMLHLDSGGEQKEAESNEDAPASNGEKPASGVVAKAEAAAEKAEGAVCGAFQGLAHMMHMDKPADPPQNSQSVEQKGAETKKTSPRSSPRS